MRRARLLVVLVVGLFVTGCLTPAAQRKLIDTVNEAQLAAAQTYDTAKAVQTAAQTACGAALRAAGQPMPVAANIRTACATVGSPVPYDPVRLQQAAGPVNALYDAVRYANTQRVASGTGDVPAAVLGGLVGSFEQVIADLTGAGITVPKSITDAVATVKAATGGPQ